MNGTIIQSRIDLTSKYVVQIGLVLQSKMGGADFVKSHPGIKVDGGRVLRIRRQPHRICAQCAPSIERLSQQSASQSASMMAGLNIQRRDFKIRTAGQGPLTVFAKPYKPIYPLIILRHKKVFIRRRQDRAKSICRELGQNILGKKCVYAASKVGAQPYFDGNGCKSGGVFGYRWAKNWPVRTGQWGCNPYCAP